MPYISGGEVLDSRQRSVWLLSSLTDIFWNIINFFAMFVQTMINPNYSSRGDRYTTDYRVTGRQSHGGGGPPPPPAPPRRRMGGFGRAQGGPACPPMAGGG